MTPLDRRTLLGSALAASVAPAVARAAPTAFPEPAFSVPLWPGEAPGLTDPSLKDEVIERSKDPAIRDRAMVRIRTPRLDVFPAARPNGAALLVMPGGGYARIVLDKEGYEVGRWFAERGVTVFVLFYRLPGDPWRDPWNAPLADAQRAMRLIRARAASWRVDPARVAAMGFSAGGHLCADLATRYGAPLGPATDAVDAFDPRPMLAAPLYPVIALDRDFAHAGSRDLLLGPNATPAMMAAHSPDLQVKPGMPPCFLFHAEDDDVVPVQNSLAFRAALKAAGVASELHLFERGGHGFGMRGAAGKPAAAWPEMFTAWAASHGWHG